MATTEDLMTRLDRIEALLERLLASGSGPRVQISGSGARLVALARNDREAAIAEAKRLSREDSLKRRQARRK